MLDEELGVTRVRHATKFRLGEVVRITPVTPHLIRITLQGEDLRGFHSASFDDHVKVFFPPLDAAPVMRDFTPRRFDPIAGKLDLEFVLHDAGPATSWAAVAEMGQQLRIGGPRGSMIIPTGFDWHLLIGDDTALPAMARRLEELPRGVRACVIAEVAGSYAQVDFKSHADLEVIWCHRDGLKATRLPEALAALPPLPAGQGYAWAAAEMSAVREVRRQLIEQRGMDKSRVRAAAYWKRGAQATHEVIDD